MSRLGTERGLVAAHDLERVPQKHRWHASIGKAIIESWVCPKIAEGDRASGRCSSSKVDGAVSLTDVLIAAKLLAAKKMELEKYPALRRIGVAAGDRAMGVMEECAEELKGVRSSLSE